MRRPTLVLLTLAALAAWWLVPALSRAQQVVVPAYQAGYSSQDDLLKQILIELQAMRREMRTGGKGGAPEGAALIGQRCASCHQDGKAEERGDGFVLVEADGKLADLSISDRRKIRRKLEKHAMPPGGGLPEAENAAVLAFVNQPPQKGQKAPGGP
jgi:mono/diheme cytochrome c family protein